MHPHPRPCTSRFSTDIYSTRPPATTQQTLGDTCRTCGVTLVPWNAIGRLPGEDTLLLKNSAMNKQALLNFCVSFIWSMHIYIYMYFYIFLQIHTYIFTHKMSVCCTYLHNKCGVWVWNLLKPNSNTCIFDGYNHMEQVDCLMNIVRGRTGWSNSNISDKLVKKESTSKEFKRKLCKKNDYKRVYIKVNCQCS